MRAAAINIQKWWKGKLEKRKKKNSVALVSDLLMKVMFIQKWYRGYQKMKILKK